MKWLAIILVGFDTSAAAAPDTDYPHRNWGQVATLDMSLAEATACIARTKTGGGASTQVIPAEGGNDIDFRPSAGLFGGSVSEPWETFKVRTVGGSTELRVFYRHPYRQGGITKDVARLQKRCLRVSSMRPD
jgi:hypothetical protein